MLPFIKWFSDTDQSSHPFPPITCVRLEKPAGTSLRTWADWFRLVKYLRELP